MDSKKANLTPELKEIYDRVMNTTGTPKPPAQPTTPAAASPAPQSPPIQPQGMPALNEPLTPPPMPGPQQPPPVQPQFHGLQQPEPPPGAPSPAEDALSSAPARPISQGGSFSFSGGNVKGNNAPQNNTTSTVKKKALISKPILITLGLVFVAVWGIFWAIIFGLIER